MKENPTTTQPPAGQAELNAEAKARWKALREHIMAETSAIDSIAVANPDYPEHEPAWWLAMMDVRRAAFKAGGAQ